MLEKKLEAKFRKAVESVGGLALKFVSPGRAGVPDRIVLAPGGRIFFVELKRPGEALRPLQQQTAKTFQELGHNVTVIDSETAIETFLQRLKNPFTHSPEYRNGWYDGRMAMLYEAIGCDED